MPKTRHERAIEQAISVMRDAAETCDFAGRRIPVGTRKFAQLAKELRRAVVELDAADVLLELANG